MSIVRDLTFSRIETLKRKNAALNHVLEYIQRAVELGYCGEVDAARTAAGNALAEVRKDKP